MSSSIYMRLEFMTADGGALPTIVAWLSKHCVQYIVFQSSLLGDPRAGDAVADDFASGGASGGAGGGSSAASGGAGGGSSAASGGGAASNRDIVRLTALVVFDSAKTTGDVRKGMRRAFDAAGVIIFSMAARLHGDNMSLIAAARALRNASTVAAVHDEWHWEDDEVPLDKMLTTIIALNKERDHNAAHESILYAPRPPARLEAVKVAKTCCGKVAYLLQGIEQINVTSIALHPGSLPIRLHWRLNFNGFASKLRFDGLPPECEMELRIDNVQVATSFGHVLDLTYIMRTCTPEQYNKWRVRDEAQAYMASVFDVDATYLMNVGEIDNIHVHIVTPATLDDGTEVMEYGISAETVEHVPYEYADDKEMLLTACATTTLPTANLNKGNQLYYTVLDHVCRESRDTKIIVCPMLPSNTRLLSFVL